MSTPYTPAKTATTSWLFLSLVGMFIGFRLGQTALWSIGVVIAIYSALSALRQFGRLLRILAVEQLYRETGGQGGPRFGHTTVPQQVFLLLFSIAEVDGRAGPRERDLVRQFVMQRFVDPAVHVSLAAWDAQPLPRDRVGPLVHELRSQLSRPECETLFFWCVLVALVDQKFNPSEHELLQTVARHLGLEPAHARRIFHHAKARVMADGRGQRQWTSWDRSASRANAPTARQRALEILGLDGQATSDDIRRRHRELVKKHHPDAHTHLGPVAEREATERFREIQDAYETLTA
jgi:DnaJ-domain-containing protein 1